MKTRITTPLMAALVALGLATAAWAQGADEVAARDARMQTDMKVAPTQGADGTEKRATKKQFETLRVQWHSTAAQDSMLVFKGDGTYTYEWPVMEKVPGKDGFRHAKEPYRAAYELRGEDFRQLVGWLEKRQWLEQAGPAEGPPVMDAVKYELTIDGRGPARSISLQDGRLGEYEELVRFLVRVEHQERVLFDLARGDDPKFAAYLLGSELDSVAGKPSTAKVYAPVLDYRRLAPTMASWVAAPEKYTKDQVAVAEKLLEKVKKDEEQAATRRAADSEQAGAKDGEGK